MKTIEQIAEDCGINGADTSLLGAVIKDISGPMGPREERLEEIIGALYRRIEKLEVDKSECHEALAGLADSGQKIIDNWERGDLAGAVTDMDPWITCARDVLSK